jgi:hypothetical protein
MFAAKAEDDSIYMLPAPSLPDIITPLLYSESSALVEARKMLLDLVFSDGELEF